MTERCARWRDLLHARLDGDAEARASEDLDVHLAACPACREFACDLRAVREGLRSLPDLPLPEEVLEEVLDRTVRARFPRRRAAAGSAWAAAAAVAAIVLAAPWIRPERPAGAGPTSEELARARQEARIALDLTACAFRDAERAARDRVLAGEVAPALRRVPVRWSALSKRR